MAQPVYRLFLLRPTDAWYQLSEDERTTLLGKVGEALAQVGGKTVLMCESQWSSEQWPFFGVEEFPDVAALQHLAELHNQIGWPRYGESMTVVGTRFEMPS